MDAKTERLLRGVTISENEPGSILRDFETLLDFLGPAGVSSNGKHSLLPLVSLRALDERMTRPARPALERPQQRSFPTIHGLYLLLRATGLGVVETIGAKGRLYVDQDLQLRWRQLNATERYFNLLEAWLVYASSEMWGEPASYLRSSCASEVLFLFDQVPMLERRRNGKSGKLDLVIASQAHLALLHSFGFVDLELETPRPGENWRVISARVTPFGDAILRCIRKLTMVPESFRITRKVARFGVLQPTLGLFFPEWKHNLMLPEAEFRDGVHRFKVSWGSIWRRIEVPAACYLDDLAGAILDALDFDYDHLYSFTLRRGNGTSLNVESPGCDAEIYSDELIIGMAPMYVGETFKFEYDFGASWKFEIKLEGIFSDPQCKKPRLVKSHGTAPEQYEWDDEDEDEDDEDEDD